jgi:biopolymer transport protein ExbB/TolQ
MKPTLNEKFLAYLALFSGLFLSLVAEYYSILGLTSIFSAAVIPVVIMGIALGLGKITATLWLKQNWKIAPWTMRGYLLAAIVVLMIVTSMGIFGFLSKAHSDQNLVSGDVLAKISIYDEKIKTEKENIETNRKALKQMDEAVDQVMGRSSSETGADKAVAIRRSQQKERSRLQQDIAQSQQTIATLNEQRAPIAAEVRKVEAEVGPIKYIAAFIYGETDQTILEKAVTWVIVILIVVFDPMAVILLLSSQISFQDFRKRLEEDKFAEWTEDDFEELYNDAWVDDVGEKPTKEELTEGDSPKDSIDIVEEQSTVTEQDELSREQAVEVAKTYIPEKTILEQDPYLTQPFSHFKDLPPMVYKAEGDSLTTESEGDVINDTTVTNNYPDMERPGDYIIPPQDITEKVMQQVLEEESHEVKPIANGEYVFINGQAYHRGSVPVNLVSYVQNEEQKDSGLWSKTIYSEKK